MQLEERPTAPHHRNLCEAGGGRRARSIFYLGQLDQQRLTWEHLETLRLKRLGIPNRYSRHLGKPFTMPRETHPLRGPSWKDSPKPTPCNGVSTAKEDKKSISTNNSLAPFFTAAKPTCGFFFSRQTDNKKRNFGIPPSDLVKWRSNAQ